MEAIRPTCPLCAKVASLPKEDLVAEFPRSVAWLGPWQYFSGYCVLVARTHATELYEMEPGERHEFLDEMTALARAIAAAVKPRKMNYELLGNQVPHLHWHLFPRFEVDAEHLQPTWLAIQRAEADEQAKRSMETGHLDRAATIAAIRAQLTTNGSA